MVTAPTPISAANYGRHALSLAAQLILDRTEMSDRATGALDEEVLAYRNFLSSCFRRDEAHDRASSYRR